MGQAMTDRLSSLSPTNARGALLGAAACAAVVVALVLAALGVAGGEVAATILFLPVFAAGLYAGRTAGYGAAAVATVAYVMLRRSDLSGAGVASAGVVVLARGAAYAVAGHVGALAQVLAGDGAASGRPATSGGDRRQAAPAVAWDDPAPRGRPSRVADDRTRVLVGAAGPASDANEGYGEDTYGDGPMTMSGAWPPDPRQGPPGEHTGTTTGWGESDAWPPDGDRHDAPPRGGGARDGWPATGASTAADDDWDAVQAAWRRQNGLPPEEAHDRPSLPRRDDARHDDWAPPQASAPSDTWGAPAPAGPSHDPWGEPPSNGGHDAGRRSDPWGTPAADPWAPAANGAGAASDPWGTAPANGSARHSDPWGAPAVDRAPMTDPWGTPIGPDAPGAEHDPWATPAPGPSGPASDPWGTPSGPGGGSADPWATSPGNGSVRHSDPWGTPASTGGAGGAGGPWAGLSPEAWASPAEGPTTGQSRAVWDDPAVAPPVDDPWAQPTDPRPSGSGPAWPPGAPASGAGRAGGGRAGGGSPAPAPSVPLPAVDPETGLWTAKFLRDRLYDERSRSRRSGRPFSMVLVQVPDGPLAQLPYRRQVTLLRELGYQFVAGGVVDHLVHVPDQAQHWFAVILPDTDRSGAQVLERRLRLGIGGYLSSRGLPLRDLDSASLTAPDDDPAMGQIWDSLIGPDDGSGYGA